MSGGVGSEDRAIGLGGLAIVGTTALGGQKRNAEFSIENIQNRREITASGLLRLAVYATAQPYDGGENRTVVATRVLGHLAPGDFYHDLQGTLRLKRPGRGAFYLSLALEEDSGSGYQMVSYVPFPDPREF